MKKLAMATALGALLLGTTQTQASIRIYASVGEGWELNGAPLSNPDGAMWHRAKGLEYMRQGVGIMDSAWVDSLQKAQNDNPPFVDFFQNNAPFSNFLVYGKAEGFKLPSGMPSGDYTFTVNADDAMFVIIDGEIMGNMCLHNDDGGGCPDPYIKPNNYEFTFRMEQGKNHEFEFYYWQATQSSTIRLFWSQGGTNYGDVPAAVFGERKQFGVPKVNVSVDGDISGISPFEVTFQVTTENTQGEDVTYLWDFDGDGTVDEESSGNTLSHSFVNFCEEPDAASCDLKLYSVRVQAKLMQSQNRSAWSSGDVIMVIGSNAATSIGKQVTRKDFIMSGSRLILAEKTSFELRDLQGRILVRAVDQGSIDLSQYATGPGAYLLQVGNRPLSRVVLTP